MAVLLHCLQCFFVTAGLMSCPWIFDTSSSAKATAILLLLDAASVANVRCTLLRVDEITYRLESGCAHVAILALAGLAAGAAGRDVRVVGLLAVGHCVCGGCERRFGWVRRGG
jgi:hypothetical protein